MNLCPWHTQKVFPRRIPEDVLGQLRTLQRAFAGQLTIKSGMEFGQLHLAREEAFNIIRNYPSIISSALSIRLKM